MNKAPFIYADIKPAVFDLKLFSAMYANEDRPLYLIGKPPEGFFISAENSGGDHVVTALNGTLQKEA